MLGSGLVHQEPRNWASGIYTYESLHDDIERIVSMKCGLYTIPGFDREDIAQEIRVFCINALAKYDAAKNHSTPFNYLARCVDNRLRNLLRDNGATLPKSKKDDPRAILRNESKLKLQNACHIDGEGITPPTYTSEPVSEFVDEISSRLETKELKTAFSILINNGPPAISKIHLRIIKRTIREYTRI